MFIDSVIGRTASEMGHEVRDSTARRQRVMSAIDSSCVSLVVDAADTGSGDVNMSEALAPYDTSASNRSLESVRLSPIPTHAQFVFSHEPITIKPSTMTTNAPYCEDPSNTLPEFKFPRTGKRGVPQQFPRNLYDMLESESKLIKEDANHPKIISWSESGKAFKIYDVAEFSLSVLPRYFRTKKFSSFQRNLNLVRSFIVGAAEVGVTTTIRNYCVRILTKSSLTCLLYLNLSVRLYQGPKRPRPGHVCASCICQGPA